MTAQVDNLVQETSTSTGTGNFTLTAWTGGTSGYQTFDGVFGTGTTTDVFYYFISNQAAAEWEVGTGHCSAANTLVRDTIIKSSNANAIVSFTAGTKYISCAVPASYISLAPPASVSAAYTFALTDAGNGVLHPSTDTTARTFTIPANSSVPFIPGTQILIVNGTSAGAITLAITTDTLEWLSGTTVNTGSRTIAAGGTVTLYKYDSTTWRVVGAGIS